MAYEGKSSFEHPLKVSKKNELLVKRFCFVTKTASTGVPRIEVWESLCEITWNISLFVSEHHIFR